MNVFACKSHRQTGMLLTGVLIVRGNSVVLYSFNNVCGWVCCVVVSISVHPQWVKWAKFTGAENAEA